MKRLTCASVRRRLTAFHDRELPVADLVAVTAHLVGCPACADRAAELRRLSDLLRSALEGGRVDLSGLHASVLERVRAEREPSWDVRVERLREGAHFVWIGLAAALATFVCGTVIFGMLYFAGQARSDSLAALIEALASPGSNVNPIRPSLRLQLPQVSEEAIPAVLVHALPEDDAVLALSAVVTREGRVGGLEVLANDGDRQAIESVLSAVSRARFEPARYAGSPVAVNLVWLLAHTTVRGKSG
ncbi:MAG TPA: zf-HC2 domain-containing protein [Vicinamibacterales bacterium]|nr:zf-HC2 domain-containing protein [Vicinamibacterales bacterium]